MVHYKENLNNLNTLKITFPYSYAIKQTKLNWHDIMVAIKNEFLPIDAVIDYAQDELEKSEIISQNIIELATISCETIFPHSIHPYIDELANLVPIKEKSKTKEKLLYILLKWVYENLSLYEDPLSVVDFIYDDFGFPEEIVGFVYYLPFDKNECTGNIGGKKILYKNWHDFIVEQEKKWGTA